MYSNQDPHGWEIRSREGKIIEKGFPNYAKAAARIRQWVHDIRDELGPEVAALAKCGAFFPTRSRG